MKGFLPEKQYKKIVESVPLLCVDVILKLKDNYILVRRDNEPLKDFWWVAGGRVLKDESVWEAAIRKIKEDVGDIRIRSMDLVGVYEDTYAKSAFGVPTHTASIVFEALTYDEPDRKGVGIFSKLPDRFIQKLYILHEKV